MGSGSKLKWRWAGRCRPARAACECSSHPQAAWDEVRGRKKGLALSHIAGAILKEPQKGLAGTLPERKRARGPNQAISARRQRSQPHPCQQPLTSGSLARRPAGGRQPPPARIRSPRCRAQSPGSRGLEQAAQPKSPRGSVAACSCAAGLEKGSQVSSRAPISLLAARPERRRSGRASIHSARQGPA